MGLLVACKNEEDPIKNEGARVVTTLFIDFSHAQGQLTLKLVMESCQNSDSSEILWLVLLSARMKKIHPKMIFYSNSKALEWSQHFCHYKSMGIFPDAQGQLTHKSLVGSCRISNPFEILWLSLLPARIKNNQSKTDLGPNTLKSINYFDISMITITLLFKDLYKCNDYNYNYFRNVIKYITNYF